MYIFHLPSAINKQRELQKTNVFFNIKKQKHNIRILHQVHCETRTENEKKKQIRNYKLLFGIVIAPVVSNRRRQKCENVVSPFPSTLCLRMSTCNVVNAIIYLWFGLN